MCITNICSTTTWTHRNFRHRIITTMAFFTRCHFRRSHLFIFLVQLLKFKIVLVAACFLIVESIEAHVGLLHLLGSIVKRGDGVLHGCYCHYHFGSENCTVRALDALRLYLEYLTHKHSVFKLSYMVYANERNESCFQIAQMQVYQVAKVGNICEPNKFIMVHK